MISNSYSDRDNQIIKYLPLVEKVVNRIEVKDPALDKDDLIGYGVIGLMDALEKYDSSKNVSFETYASFRIKGTVIDELRRMGKVSRNKISKLNDYYKAKEKLENELMRTPDEFEICKELGIDEKELSKIHETVHYLSNYSLEATLFSDNGEFSLIELIEDETIGSPLDRMMEEETREILVQAIDQLKDREKTILNLYYVEELSLKEIAYVLDISIPRVSQIHGKILIKLREIIERLQGDNDV
ncbi:MAG: FliA/WhiG family RNA polymerase sigma factor [Tissierellia bacterium]|nr:FliA/WhiG family RNA polymerase sigma factor [Tissierellia bacterium]